MANLLLQRNRASGKTISFGSPTTPGSIIIIVMTWEQDPPTGTTSLHNRVPPASPPATNIVDNAGNIYWEKSRGDNSLVCATGLSGPSLSCQNITINPHWIAAGNIDQGVANPTGLRLRIYEVQHCPQVTGTSPQNTTNVEDTSSSGLYDGVSVQPTSANPTATILASNWSDMIGRQGFFLAVLSASPFGPTFYTGIATGVASPWVVDDPFDDTAIGIFEGSADSNVTSTFSMTGNVDPYGILMAAWESTDAASTWNGVLPPLPATGNIVIQKATSPPGSSQSFTFRPSYASSFTLVDGQSNDSGALAPGTYSVSEDAVAGWTTTTSQDPTAIVVVAGQTTTVVFTNTQAAPALTGAECTFVSTSPAETQPSDDRPTLPAPAGPQTWVYDFGTRGWFQLQRGFTSLAVFEIGEGEQILVGGAEDGFVYVIEDLNGTFDFSGTCPQASFRPALIDFGDPSSMRVFKYLELEFTSDALAQDITVTYWLDPPNVDNPGEGKTMSLVKVRGADRWRAWPSGGSLCQRLLIDITARASTNTGAIRGAKIVADKVKGLTT